MKITIDFDATPDEARRFFGLPDIAPMQEALVAEMTEKMQASLKSMEPDQLWRKWMPAGGMPPSGMPTGADSADIPAGIDAMKQFWEQAMRTAMTSGAAHDPTGDKS